MTIYITKVHLVGGTAHEHIAEVGWENRSTKETGTSTRQQVVVWLEGDNANQARVADGQSFVAVGVVNATPKYIRTHADGKWTDNLLALPRY